ncbi:MAG: hypothetical protein VB878_24935 [Pirellulaceae bacterium]
MILAKKQLDRETPAVNWRRRYWKAVLMGAIGGLVVGILPGVVFLGLGSEIEDTNAALLLFVVVPLTTAASLSILAMGAMASLKHLDWLTGGSLSRSQKSKGD